MQSNDNEMGGFLEKYLRSKRLRAHNNVIFSILRGIETQPNMQTHISGTQIQSHQLKLQNYQMHYGFDVYVRHVGSKFTLKLAILEYLHVKSPRHSTVFCACFERFSSTDVS